jgi:hypothetical protein
MKIEDLESKRPVHLLGLGLTRAEARELRDDLEALLGGGEIRHEHVASIDFQTELTVWIDDDQ